MDSLEFKNLNRKQRLSLQNQLQICIFNLELVGRRSLIIIYNRFWLSRWQYPSLLENPIPIKHIRMVCEDAPKKTDAFGGKDGVDAAHSTTRTIAFLLNTHFLLFNDCLIIPKRKLFWLFRVVLVFLFFGCLFFPDISRYD